MNTKLIFYILKVLYKDNGANSRQEKTQTIGPSVLKNLLLKS